MQFVALEVSSLCCDLAFVAGLQLCVSVASVVAVFSVLLIVAGVNEAQFCQREREEKSSLHTPNDKI